MQPYDLFISNSPLDNTEGRVNQLVDPFSSSLSMQRTRSPGKDSLSAWARRNAARSMVTPPFMAEGLSLIIVVSMGLT